MSTIEPLTPEERQMLVDLFKRATNCVLQLPAGDTAVAWLSEFVGAPGPWFRALEAEVVRKRQRRG